MASNYYVAVTCPSCGTKFQTPVEQVLDVRVDPEAKNRLISGAVNMAVCPNCRVGGRLNVPFVYHDPEEEVALLYLPMEVGKTEVERQQIAGTLTRQLMDSMPMEERKGYLLQPETFINMETMVKRVLEIEGVTEEDLQRNQDQRAFLREMLEAPRESWDELVEEHKDLLDETFFGLMEYTLQLMAMSGPESAEFEKVRDVHDYLVEETELGRYLASRAEVLRDFSEDPNRDTLLEALLRAPDEDTQRMLIQAGLPLMDYAFFQKLLKRKEEAEDPEAAERIAKLRKKILDMRDQIMKASQELAEERMQLVEKLVATEDPVKMARSHLSELDEPFFFVLRSQMEAAQEQGDAAMVASLERVTHAVNQVMEATVPPEFALLRSLIVTPAEEERDQVLEQNVELLTPSFFQLLMMLEETSRERGDAEEAEELVKIRNQAARHAPEAAAEAAEIRAAAEQQGTSPPAGTSEEPPSGSETQTPSGLIIAKK